MYKAVLQSFSHFPLNFSRSFSTMFLGNEFQKDLKKLYLHVHPDVMAAFPESVKKANKNSLQVHFSLLLIIRF